MKEIEIISKIIGRYSDRTSKTGAGKDPKVNLSGYLMKEIWDKVFEIKKDDAGTEYIYGKLPVVVQYGVTMYGDNGMVDLPGLYDGLPIDGNTLIRDKNGVLMVNPNLDIGGGGASTWEELEGKPSWIGSTKPTYEYSEIINTPDLNKYVTKSWIDGQYFVTQGWISLQGFATQYWVSQNYLSLYGGTISGNLTVTGGLTFYSDIRKKTKIKDVELTVDQIADAPLIEHYYNDDVSKTTHVGSIAQYWAEMNDWFCKKDSEGYYTMETQNCALASAISIAREFRKYKSETESIIRELKEEIKSLKERL